MATKVLDHALIHHKLTIMRDKDTKANIFKQNLDEIAMLIAYEATKDLTLDNSEIETPLTKMTGKQLQKEVVLVPILRAGLGFLDGFRRIIPTAKVGHIGIARDEETLAPHEYYAKFPKHLDASDIIVLDPMLATGGSAIDTINNVKKRGAKSIRFVCLVAAPEGVKKMEEIHPDVDIYIGELDDCLNDHGYIVPGLGDAGDRLFGTE